MIFLGSWEPPCLTTVFVFILFDHVLFTRIRKTFLVYLILFLTKMAQILKMFIYVHSFVHCMCVCMPVWRLEDTLQETVLSLHHRVPRDKKFCQCFSPLCPLRVAGGLSSTLGCNELLWHPLNSTRRIKSPDCRLCHGFWHESQIQGSS